MNKTFSPVDWDIFKNTKFINQGAFGVAPSIWVRNNNIKYTGKSKLPDVVLTRQKVREYCQDPNLDVIYGYISAMSWGMQGARPGGLQTVQNAWSQRAKIEKILIELKKGDITRDKAYSIFKNSSIMGLGPAYFTKLIYFFLSSSKGTGYIMDQWTAKSINLLTRKKIVRLAGSWPTHDNSSENYEAFCKIIDYIGERLECSGDIVEQRLFSQNAANGQERGPWREHVYKTWEINRPTERYSEASMLTWVNDLLQN
jgi:hypothetical protein